MALARLAAGIVLGLPLGISQVLSEELSFGPDLAKAGWTALSFPSIAPAVFKATGRAGLEVSTDAAAGLLSRPVGKSLWRARRAQWRWRVHQGAPATDLTRRGADDRALGLYLVFGTADDAGKGAMALLGSASVTALVYVFGSDKPRERILPSPHMQGRGRFIVLRSADAQKSTWFQEDVDIARDYMRAFGRPPALLLAVAVMSDSDDTRTRNRAEIEGLDLE